MHDFISGRQLQGQYERWQQRAKYKTHLDPTVEDVKKLVLSCRRAAKVTPFYMHQINQNLSIFLDKSHTNSAQRSRAYWLIMLLN